MFRKTIFWTHLVAGLISGVVIGIMCFTGTVLAFEKELIAWSERDARQIAPPPTDAPRLTLAQMQARLREVRPEARPAGIVFQNDPHAAVAFTTGRSGGFYVNPYTGELRQPQSAAMSEFMHTVTDLHRYLGFHGAVGRPRGKLINGVCNLAFFALAVTGLYLWMPRAWSWRAVQPVIWFRQNSSGKARDFNWHNAIGFWSAPVLIVLTLTAVPISFRWGGTLINTLTGTPASAAGPGPAAAAPALPVVPPAPDAQPLALDALVAAAQKQVPEWKTITLRLGGIPGGQGGSGPANRGGRGAEVRPSAIENAAAPATSAPQSEARNPQSLAAATIAIRESTSWPRTATTTLTLNPYTGEILRRTGYAELPAAQRVRAWTRFLHTGEALGWGGQLIAGLACLGGCFLVYTGFALSWRRFFSRAKVED